MTPASACILVRITSSGHDNALPIAPVAMPLASRCVRLGVDDDDFDDGEDDIAHMESLMVGYNPTRYAPYKVDLVNEADNPGVNKPLQMPSS